MRVGILTYHCVPNFGAQLQVLSTVQFLKRKGHEPIILNWYPKDLEEMYSHRIPKCQITVHNQFVDSYLPVTCRVHSETDLINIIFEYKINYIIHGSDALFKYQPERGRRHFSKRRLKYIVNDADISVEGIDENLFWGGYLANLPNVRAVVYAVSSQNCPYNLLTFKEKNRLRDRLLNFEFISVRDEWTERMVSTIMGRKTKVEIAPDPVFSFNDNCSDLLPTKDEIITKFNLPENYVLISFWTHHLSDSYIQEIAKELENRGLIPVALPMPEGLLDFGIMHKIYVPLNPMDWYALIKYSSGYIGERMHPIVVALHNSVPFFSFDEYGVQTHNMDDDIEARNSSKIYSILKTAELLHNSYSYKYDVHFPSPKIVVDSIVNFKFEVCSNFSQNQSDKYIISMNRLLSILDGNEV